MGTPWGSHGTPWDPWVLIGTHGFPRTAPGGFIFPEMTPQKQKAFQRCDSQRSEPENWFWDQLEFPGDPPITKTCLTNVVFKLRDFKWSN